ncbi:MAG: 2-C-methyl-D-erythritol 4-phosphate cytidylyltransferase [Nitrospira sp.]|nr:2-C-methyl-D-erythritol 4-phosphate cytidylyltransferase [Nitrospira sp.]
MNHSSRIWAIVPAAGTGFRMGRSQPKQYLTLAGRAVMVHTLERLCSHPRIEGVLVGLAAEDRDWASLKDAIARLPMFLGTYEGGAERADTVLNGLRALGANADPADWVMVHDAARPCIRHEDIDRLIRETQDHPDGGLLARPVADTVKRTDSTQLVQETVPRTHLWRALTPQLFPLERLTGALEQALAAGVTVTDEAAAIEHTGGHPRVVAGHADNIKITLADDLALAELFLKQQEREHA